MLQYLVTSKTRRLLLSLLWGEGAEGSVGELAERAGVAFASAHTELKAMYRAGLVESRHEGGREVYRASLAHPDAAALQTLVASDVARSVPSADGDETLRGKLRALGAPLRGVSSVAVAPEDQMETLVEAVGLARRDPVVARSLPLCFWKLRDSLTSRALTDLRLRVEDKHALGFFLELTSELGGDRRLLGVAEALRDRRVKSPRDFFQNMRRPDSAPTFPLAEKWGFLMTMDLDSFRSLFNKFVDK
jgi:DNA-binding transcriptional ArsR family regulator